MISSIKITNSTRTPSENGTSDSFALDDVCAILKEKYPTRVIPVAEIWFHGTKSEGLKLTAATAAFDNDAVILVRNFISYSDHPDADDLTDVEIQSIFDDQEKIIINAGFVEVPHEISGLENSISYIYPNNEYAKYIMDYKSE